MSNTYMEEHKNTVTTKDTEEQAMRAINLLSLLNAQADLNDLSFKKYVGGFGINPHIRKNELEDLQSLVESLRIRTPFTYIFNGFFVGFLINQIGKEFDLLRIGQNSVINIELKRKSTEEKIVKQLIQNEYYLKFLDVKLYNFTYVSSTEKLYMLVDSTYIEEVPFEVLIDKLREQHLMEIDNLHHLFDPINYLVSPFESPEAFLKDEYFLTAQQSTFKREILDYPPVDEPTFITLEGGPGTGKTLLLYDIAKDYIRQSRGVKIYHCGKLNAGHETLKKEHGWHIESLLKKMPPVE
ncbi:MAG: ATP-binding protein, partial [Lysinibacillus sp.]